MKKTLLLCFWVLGVGVGYAQDQNAQVYMKAVEEIYNKLEVDKFEQAVDLIDTLLLDYPNSSRLHRLKGDGLCKKARLFSLDTVVYQNALACYNKAIDLDTKQTTFLNFYRRSLLHFSHHKFYEAINDLSIALKLCENKEDKLTTLKQRSIVFIYLNRKEEAIADCKAILKLNPDSDNTYSNLGLLFLRAGEYEKAERLFETAIELNPNHKIYSNNLGIIYLKQGKYQEAEALYDKFLAMEIKPDPLLLNNRGFARINLGKLKLAKKDIDQSISIYPDNSYAYKNRALLYIKVNKIDRACRDIEKSLDLKYTETYGDEVLKLQEEYCQ